MSVWLAGFSTFMDGEKQKEERHAMLGTAKLNHHPKSELLAFTGEIYANGQAGPLPAPGGSSSKDAEEEPRLPEKKHLAHRNAGANTAVQPLYEALCTMRLDAFTNYLLGLVLRAMGRHEEARAALCESVVMYPWNWSAWLDLASVCDPGFS